MFNVTGFNIIARKDWTGLDGECKSAAECENENVFIKRFQGYLSRKVLNIDLMPL